MAGNVDVTGIVLAGGSSKRFGSDKAWAELDGRPLLQWVANALATVCREVIVVRARGQRLPAVALDVPARLVTDEVEGQGPLAGLFSAFAQAETEYCVVAPVDVPLLRPALVRLLAERVQGHDVAVPVVRGYREPLLAAYRSTRCEQRFRESFAAGNRKVGAAYEGLDVLEVTERMLRVVDADLRSFRNANEPEVLASLGEFLRKGSGGAEAFSHAIERSRNSG